MMVSENIQSELSVPDWRDIVSQKQKDLREGIPKSWIIPHSVMSSLQMPLFQNSNRLLDMDMVKKSGLLSETEHKITEDYTVSELLTALAGGSLTSVEVTTAFSKRAAIAQQLVGNTLSTHKLLAKVISDQLFDRNILRSSP
jgi:amidase